MSRVINQGRESETSRAQHRMNGNTYFIDPHDERELARLQLQDNLFNEIIDLLPRQFVPFSGARVLDLACGPGGWLLRVAQAYPDLSVVGVDISPPMILYARAQAEARTLAAQFSIMDALKIPWNFPDQSFDVVNFRFVGQVFPVFHWERLLPECWRILRARGVIRYIEATHLNAPTSPSIQKLIRITYEGIYKAGLSFSPLEMANSPVLGAMLKQQGFEQILLSGYVADLSYGTPLHRPILDDLLTGQNLLQPFLIRLKVSTAEELSRLEEGLAREWLDERFSAHWHLCAVEVVKPEGRK